MAGRILKLQELSSTALDNLHKDRTVLFIPISPMEGHGSHLPLGLDFFNAEYFAEKAAGVTVGNKPEFDAVICPGIPLGTQLFRQTGSLRTDPIVIYRIARDIGSSLARSGFRFIFIVSGHGSPKDIVALEAAARRVSRDFKVQMHNLSGALAIRFLKGEFIDRISSDLSRPLDDRDKELLKKDIHGGWWETSMMLYLRPHLVGGEYKTLPATEKGSGERPSYFGSPSKASAEFAEISMKVMVEEVGDIIIQCLSGKDITDKTTSPLYRILLLRPYFKRRLFLTILWLVELAVIVWIASRIVS